jgi:hypothetical protein
MVPLIGQMAVLDSVTQCTCQKKVLYESNVMLFHDRVFHTVEHSAWHFVHRTGTGVRANSGACDYSAPH